MRVKIAAALAVFGVLWIAWCIFAIRTLVPAITMYITFYREFWAWLLCVTPAAGVVFAILKIKKE